MTMPHQNVTRCQHGNYACPFCDAPVPPIVRNLRPGQSVTILGITYTAPGCPDTCPECGADLKADGYPLGHQTDEGKPCAFDWSD